MQQSSAKRASIIAMTAALYAVFFYVSSIVSLSGFTLLYLPVILLGVFPIWFGWNGLVGSMIGAFIGGALVEGFGLLGIFEVITAIIIFVPNWIFLPKNSFTTRNKESRNSNSRICHFPVRWHCLHSLAIFNYS